MYLELRRRVWMAFHDVPEDVQKVIGKRRFAQSLETDNRNVAERRAAPLKMRWLAEIEQARHPSSNPVERDAAYWQRVLKETPEADREMVLELLGDEAREKANRAAERAGITDHRDPEYAELPEVIDGQRMVAIATGKLVRLDAHLEEYLATLRNEKKTVDMKRSTIKDFCKGFQFIPDVQRREVQKWLNGQAQDGKRPATLQRALSELRGYWSYLQSIEAAGENSLPFEKLSIATAIKDVKASERLPFNPADVVKLWKAAKKDGDQELADLIELEMWTGARIEELCGLPKDRASTESFKIADAKTPAGVREVPIHAKLKSTVARLLRESKDGFLLSGLTVNKYKKRHDAIGKRFGRLKSGLGFGPQYVFHSIRKTVTTQFENAHIPEGIAADIIGHKKKSMTYGVYSGGASMKVKRAAIEKLRYPL